MTTVCACRRRAGLPGSTFPTPPGPARGRLLTIDCGSGQLGTYRSAAQSDAPERSTVEPRTTSSGARNRIFTGPSPPLIRSSSSCAASVPSW